MAACFLVSQALTPSFLFLCVSDDFKTRKHKIRLLPLLSWLVGGFPRLILIS